MSEYQIVTFRAIDRPLTDKQLAYMDRQSSRAAFTKWEFKVEYNYSSFRGDVDGMLRNGYDVFSSNSNYGCREVRMRLPNGLPFPKSVWSKYISNAALKWTADKKGKAGILSLEPCLDDPELDWEFDDYLDSLAKMRELLIAGDLRALYVLWLCCAADMNEDSDELLEPPVPHGLAAFPSQAADLLDFFDVDPLLMDAAAIGIPTFNSQVSQDGWVESWLGSLADTHRAEIIKRLLSEDPVALKAELLLEIRDHQPTVSWPVEPPTRTLSQLLEICERLSQEEDEKQQIAAAAKAKRAAKKAEKQRQARLAEMKSATEQWLEKASQLVDARGTENYRKAAEILADVRDAVGGDQGDKLARKHAAHLAKSYPTLYLLRSSLREKQLLD